MLPWYLLLLSVLCIFLYSGDFYLSVTGLGRINVWWQAVRYRKETLQYLTLCEMHKLWCSASWQLWKICYSFRNGRHTVKMQPSALKCFHTVLLQKVFISPHLCFCFFSNMRFLMIALAYSVPTGVVAGWAGVLDMILTPAKVSQVRHIPCSMLGPFRWYIIGNYKVFRKRIMSSLCFDG